MALITLFSAKGSPGVTTTAMLLASLWPRPSILVDADPMGGDVALRLPAAGGRALSRDRGLLSLLPVARRGLLPDMVAQHSQVALGGQPVVAGLSNPEQADAVGPLWATLADAFAAVSDADVVVDAGHVGARSPHRALVDRADVVVVVYRPTAPSVVHTRQRLEGLADSLSSTGRLTGVLAVAPPKGDTDLTSSVAAMRGDLNWLHDFGAVVLDPKAVPMFDGVDVLRPERTLLARSGRTAAQLLFDRGVKPRLSLAEADGVPSDTKDTLPTASAEPTAAQGGSQAEPDAKTSEGDGDAEATRDTEATRAERRARRGLLRSRRSS